MTSQEFASFIDVTRHRGLTQPQAVAFTFLESAGKEESITYGELDVAVRSVAAGLQGSTKPGTRVLLLLPPGLEYVISFLACLAAGVVAVPAYPPTKSKTNNGVGRLMNIAKDCGAEVVLATSEIVNMSKVLSFAVPQIKTMKWLSCDKMIKAAKHAHWREPDLKPDDLAFLQYTSGSTGHPKGVMVTHGNLIHNSELIHLGTGTTPAGHGTSWLPPYHDMGLITGILQPLYVGFPCCLMSPLTFIKEPFLWLDAVSRHKTTASGGPNFAYDLCVATIDDAKVKQLDLSHWDIGFTGAEPIRQVTIDKFAAKFAVAGFKKTKYWPCYGLAEGTLIVTGAALDHRVASLIADPDKLQANIVQLEPTPTARSVPLVGSGRPLRDIEVRLVSPDTLAAISGDDQVGEIWVNGPSVAKGYWGNPELTAEIFAAEIAGEPGKRYLRTGDLGFLHSRDLFVTGRLKDLIIVNGRNHYPHDIELTAQEAEPRLRPGQGAAFSVDVAGKEEAVLVFEADPAQAGYDPAAMKAAVTAAVAGQHELHLHAVVLIEPRKILKTTSGKIRRQAIKTAYQRGEYGK